MPEDGRRTIPDSTIMEAISKLEPEATTPDIADEIGTTRQGAGYRLRQLEEEGRVRSKMIGRTKLWYSTD